LLFFGKLRTFFFCFFWCVATIVGGADGGEPIHRATLSTSISRLGEARYSCKHPFDPVGHARRNHIDRSQIVREQRGAVHISVEDGLNARGRARAFSAAEDRAMA